MDTCNKLYEKLMFFDDLSHDEQKEVKLHANNCERCSKQLKEFQAIMFSLKKNQDTHRIDDELLLRYSIHLAEPEVPDYDGKKLTRSEITSIKKHMTECEQCQKKIALFSHDYQEIDEYLEKSDFPSLSLATKSYWTILTEKLSQLYESVTEPIKNILFAPLPRLVPIAVGAMAVVFITIWFGPFFRDNDNPYLELVSLQQEEISFLTRSSISEELKNGLSDYQEGQYKKAIQNLELFILNNETNPSLFFAHYVLGISYLTEARTDLFGRFQRIDPDMVDKGILNLQKAQSLSNISSIQENCNWYIANVFLLQGEVNKAKEFFEIVINIRGRRFKEAQKIIKDIDDILIPQ